MEESIATGILLRITVPHALAEAESFKQTCTSMLSSIDEKCFHDESNCGGRTDICIDRYAEQIDRQDWRGFQRVQHLLQSIRLSYGELLQYIRRKQEDFKLKMDTIKVYTLKLFLLSASLIAALCLGFCLARSSEICTPTGFLQAAFLVLLLYCRDDRNSIWSILRSLNYSNVAWTKLQNNIETLERARYRLLLVIEQARTSEICMKNNWIEIRRVTGVFRFAAQHQKICCGQVILPTMKHVLQCLETSIEQMKEQLRLLHEFIQQATFSWGM